MLSGMRPWEGMSMVQIAFAVLKLYRPPMNDLSEERCPLRLRKVLAACWDPVPERRPAASEIVKEIMLVQEKIEVTRHSHALHKITAPQDAPRPSYGQQPMLSIEQMV
ncbi:hypothetical protein HYH03_003929 [Edaphochlamys debaryana]|uniref:Serine-threonine/tyrosine-protein kinase catalytic domain-containing protein n=1 Tax=Edaphochlamys debaryana TaxID=47281 RepID=A0A836C3Y0_9CHLO|nr:hypothetical protein HYH03_003929 [Edaphochlamys debaryana]|eukprot:KAG2498174.1 hypothetical protein HYH03_003929 [Edaphochlamys debaryana]